MGRGVYMDWLNMLEKLTPDDILTGPTPRDTPKYAEVMLEKLRSKFSAITPDELSACQKRLAEMREKETKRTEEWIRREGEDRREREKIAAENGIRRAEREAHDKRLSELGIPNFVEPDGPDAAVRVIRLASMRGSERAKIMDGLSHSFGCANCDRENGCDGTCEHDGLQTTVCLSEWKWIQKTAERCIEKGETVYPAPAYPKLEEKSGLQSEVERLSALIAEARENLVLARNYIADGKKLGQTVAVELPSGPVTGRYVSPFVNKLDATIERLSRAEKVE